MAKTICAGLEIAYTAGCLELTQRGIHKPSEGELSGIPEVTDDCPTNSATSIPVSPLNCLYFKLPTGVWLCAGSTVEQQHPALQDAGGRDRSLVGCLETTAQNGKAGCGRLETGLGSWPAC